MKIYTKTGDRGDTRLFDGTKVRKHNERVDAYGDVDELNSFIGAAASFLKDASLASMLAEVQKDLFSVGAQRWCYLSKKAFHFANTMKVVNESTKPCVKPLLLFQFFLLPAITLHRLHYPYPL